MQNREDRRVIKTKKNLGDSLLSLLKEENIEDIKINKLCEKAEISRATFYNNFRNVSEVLSYELGSLLIGDDIEYFLRYDTKSVSVEISYRRYLSRIIHQSLLHQEELLLINGGRNENVLFTAALRDFHYSSLMRVLSPHKEAIEKKIPLELLVDFFALSLAGFEYYLLNHKEEDEGKLSEYAFHLSYHLILEYLNRNPLKK